MNRINYDNYKKTDSDWMGEVPDHWEITKLKFVANIQSSNVDKHVKDDEHPVLLCNYVDVYYNDKITESISFMKGSATKDEIDKFGLMEGDVLLTKDSESWDDIAIPALVTNTINDLVCGYHLAMIRPNREKLLGEFLYRCLASTAFNYQFQIAANGVTRYGIPKYAIDNAYVICPPIQEQRAICKFLSIEEKRVNQIVKMLGGKETIDHASQDSMIGKLTIFLTSLVDSAVLGKIDVRNVELGMEDV